MELPGNEEHPDANRRRLPVRHRILGGQQVRRLDIEDPAPMIKRDELNDPNSCLNRAADDEWLFVLRAHDVAAPATIEEWCRIRIEMGKNTVSSADTQITEAYECAWQMRLQQTEEE
jgi:hypothetical protein